MKKKSGNYYDFLVLGAGVAGLGAGVVLKKENKDCLILEKNHIPGGLNRSFTFHGCDFDFGPKILLLDDSENSKEILSFLGDNYGRYPVIEKTYLSQFGLLGFPLQRHLIDLPDAERKKVIKDLEKAKNSPRKVRSFIDWLINSFGKHFCNLVLFPYEEKKWKIPLSQMDYKWALNRPIKVDYGEIIKGSKACLLPNKFYYYPKVGNISVLTKAMLKIAGPISLDSEVVNIHLKDKFVETKKGKLYYRHLISSLPLNWVASKTCDLPKKMKDESGKKLKCLDILIFNLVFDGKSKSDGTAIYFPEKKYIFRRVSILQNLCPALARDNLTPILVEISIKDKKVSKNKAELILKQILLDIKKVEGLKDLGKLLDWKVSRIDFAYPFQLNGLSKTVRKIQKHYRKFDVHHCGRGGNLDYCNSDQAYKQGKETALEVLRNNSIE